MGHHVWSVNTAPQIIVIKLLEVTQGSSSVTTNSTLHLCFVSKGPLLLPFQGDILQIVPIFLCSECICQIVCLTMMDCLHHLHLNRTQHTSIIDQPFLQIPHNQRWWASLLWTSKLFSSPAMVCILICDTRHYRLQHLHIRINNPEKYFLIPDQNIPDQHHRWHLIFKSCPSLVSGRQIFCQIISHFLDLDFLYLDHQHLILKTEGNRDSQDKAKAPKYFLPNWIKLKSREVLLM